MLVLGLFVDTEAYLASGKDGYDVFRESRLIMDEECAPLIPNLVRGGRFRNVQTGRHI